MNRKQLAALLLAGTIGFSSGPKANSIHYTGAKSTRIGITEATSRDIHQIEKRVLAQLNKTNVILDKKFSTYIKGIAIDGDYLSVELTNGKILEVTQARESIDLTGLTNLDYLYIQDSKIIDYVDNPAEGLKNLFKELFSNHTEINLKRN